MIHIISVCTNDITPSNYSHTYTRGFTSSSQKKKTMKKWFCLKMLKSFLGFFLYLKKKKFVKLKRKKKWINKFSFKTKKKSLKQDWKLLIKSMFNRNEFKCNKCVFD